MRRKEVRVVSAIREKNKVSEEDYSFDMRSLGHVVCLFHVLCDGREDARYIGRGTTPLRLLLCRGVKSKLAGRYDDSFELYKHCLDIKPDAAEALYNLGLYYLGMDDSARCASHLSRAVALEPENIYYKEALASFYLRNRDDVKAVPVLEDMVRCNPTRSDVLAQLVNMYMDREQYREAISALDRIETLEGKNLSISMEKFRLYRELKEDDQALPNWKVWRGRILMIWLIAY